MRTKATSVRARTPRALTWAALTLVAALSACGWLWLTGHDGSGPRPLTASETQRLALARFRTYQGSPTEVTVHAPVPGATAVVHAVVDQRRHRAVGWYETTSGTARDGRGLLAWDGTGLALARPKGTTVAVGSVPQAVREAGRLTPDAWIRRPFGHDAFDTALRLTLTMAADRPDNAQLLAQSGALHLREEDVDGSSYDVFSGPRPRPNASASPAAGRSPLTYWIAPDGRLRRVAANLDTGHTATIDLGATRVRPGVPGTPWSPRR
ncbi:hypothetical protein [Streptomyces sp. NBC_00989]|uniref:hypothetical protein n=1 Tax=Streptomyces sp. NBC_00989 TaxID=2903705 RepID=UPI00386CD215|nr:hypothetical protein OG714_02350 [Streptomyces sp. NBC_00989]